MKIIEFLKTSLSRAQKQPTKKESSTAFILRPNPNQSLELLLIKRSVSTRDKHSGQISFPGGKLEKEETSLFAAIRETFEEVGVTLNESEYLGHTGVQPAYGGGLRISDLLLTNHIFFVNRPLNLLLNPNEVNSYRWVDIETFTHDLGSYKRPKFNTLTHDEYKTWMNPTGVISGDVAGFVIPKSRFCDSEDYSEYHLWGATLRKIREIIMMLPTPLRSVQHKDWVHYNLAWPNKLKNPYLTFLDTYFPKSLNYRHYII